MIKLKSLSTMLLIALVITNLSCSSDLDNRTISQSPNIIFFLVDDMGWQDTSLPFWTEETMFNRKFNTPNMERLAEQGMKFTQAYACTVCSPSRVSLMSGMNAARHRVTDWTLFRNTSNEMKDKVLEYPRWNMNGLQPEGVDSIENAVSATTLAQILRDNGYYTIHSGKAHWGAQTTAGEDPLNLGFDVNIAGHCAGGVGSFLGIHDFSAAWRSDDPKQLIWDVPGIEKYHGEDIHLSEVLTIEAKSAMDEALDKNKPFYLYMSHYAVHTPLEPQKPYYQKYKEIGLEESEACYASMVEGMDKSLGDLMAYLEEKGIADNTVILFMSDNGGKCDVPSRGGIPFKTNLPLNAGKRSAFEGGLRVPMIAKWPGVVNPGTINDNYLIIEDYFPSILEIAGIEDYKTKQDVDGRSFVPLLTQKGSSEGRDLFWHVPNGKAGPLELGFGATSTIRSGDWKLVYWYKDQHFNLFNIKDDIGEENNLSNQYPQRVKEMAIKLSNYLRSVDAQRPRFKATGELVPWPDEALNI